ncbi:MULTISPECIES: site-specific integrase [unclassified Empedobacter]|uniref:site-specific integrase n=1 Tax=unclassified Empedobacter TaxID=2643773 RepID=UPI0025C4AD21|nr:MULTISPECIES: site-specific integrase [unclassified Empedobacter]
MQKVNYKPIFNRTGKLRKDGTSLIQIECYQGGKRFLFSLGIYATPSQWNEKNKKLNSHYPNYHKLNKQIYDTISELENYELDFLNKGKTFTLDNLRDFRKADSFSNFIEFMQLELNRAKISISTRKTHQRTLDVLKEYKKNMDFSDINVPFLQDYERYLYSKNLGVNSVHKYFKNIKTYVNLAISKGLHDANEYPFPKLKIKQTQGKRDFLTPLEVENIENLVFEKPLHHGIEKIRDMFLFSCYTGLRFSDIIQINKNSFEMLDGQKWLIVEMEKSKIAGKNGTAQIVRIPLSKLFNGKPIEILNKYESDRLYYFDDFTNQHVNRILKTIAEQAKIKKLVTFHVARHTQATYLLYKGVSMTVVSKLLGHKKIATTQIYAKVMDMTIVNELDKISF